MSPDGKRILLKLDVAAARKAWPLWIGRISDDEVALAALHRARIIAASVFDYGDRRVSTVWLMMHGFGVPGTSYTGRLAPMEASE